MSSDSGIAVAVTGLGKFYRLFDRPQDRLKQGFLRRKKYFREFWALRDVTFTVRRGETVGIVGKNGSGKSTLLQMIAGTLTPTNGTIDVRGRVAALLELGTGFNPEFTGRENVYVNGLILGLSRAEIDEHFDEIVDFAEIGTFIDQPVRIYSSGMVVRLAFAVQAIAPKDILIVDEVLAVGDEAFQRKCFSKIEEFRDRGGTILFVSHNAQLVVQLCERAILLDLGELLLQGRSKPVVHRYQLLVNSPAAGQDELRREFQELGAKPGWDDDEDAELAGIADPSIPAEADAPEREGLEGYDPELVSRNPLRYTSRGAKIEDPHLTNLEGRRVNVLVSGQPYLYRYHIVFEKPFTKVRCGMLIKTVSGLELAGRPSAPAGEGLQRVEAGEIIEVSFRFEPNLNSGTYFINAGVMAREGDEEVFLDRVVDAMIFNVLPGDTHVVGLVDFSIEPRLRQRSRVDG